MSTESSAAERFVHEQFRAFVLSGAHPCLGAHAAVQSGHYRLRLYDDMREAASARALLRDLIDFDAQRSGWDTQFATYVASFRTPVPHDEEDFERLLWGMLGLLREADAPAHAWDPAVSSDPRDPRFSFSVGGGAFFVVGLHAASSRFARRFAWPTLCFNAHDQFERLRAGNRFQRLRDSVRTRDLALQSTLNPMAADHGTASEAPQYSGRAVGPDWRCPLPAEPR